MWDVKGILSAPLLLALLVLAGCDSGEPQTAPPPVFHRVGEYFYADWGPDNLLAVIHVPKVSAEAYSDELGGLYSMRLDGSEKRLLVLDAQVGRIYSPQWSPDGQWIAFEAGAQIFKVSADGSQVVQLTRSDRGKHVPSWSPDGEWVSYQVHHDWMPDRGLWRVKSDGSGDERRFRRPPPEEMCIGCPPAPENGAHGPGYAWVSLMPDWSPLGNEFIYVGFENQAGHIHLARYDTTAARVEFIHRQQGGIEEPRFSPDASRIAFVVPPMGGGEDLRIGTVHRNGSGLRWLAEGAVHPSWSPDGSHLVFLRKSNDPERYRDPGFGDLWIMNADGSGKQQITFSNGRAR